ncbi:hypothetical protein LEP1GSC060_3596 [Leptospira weilii serovar Ranarum str. ICFT]|uniref:Bacteriophage CI repressor protein n=1 Tax=Leptospira weilii serovar Ranarum str. ICFT TaxID=1218598 RepID=N1WJU1_9LEPT|nr:hypothetical protein [Leptospira weilii]EMY79215.1 hypothetical protein LEP1GSC060_3596 [Leptospira weilii serovar Ranarum str. ICFT]
MEKFERLQMACDELEINRKGLAELLRIHPSNASRLLTGETEFTWTYAELFQLKTNISAIWVMEGQGEFWLEESDGKKYTDYEILNLRIILKVPGLMKELEKLVKLPQEDQKFVIGLIDRFYKLSETLKNNPG